MTAQNNTMNRVWKIYFVCRCKMTAWPCYRPVTATDMHAKRSSVGLQLNHHGVTSLGHFRDRFIQNETSSLLLEGAPVEPVKV